MMNFEVERKYIVSPGFDLGLFLERVEKLGPTQSFEVVGEENYFLLDTNSQFIYRHRFDSYQQKLTAKTINFIQNDCRKEIEIELPFGKDNQFVSVREFLKTFGISWTAKITKKTHVFQFKDCEIVFYRAQSAENSHHTEIGCIEIEAHQATDYMGSQSILESYEKKLDIAIMPTQRSLFEILFWDYLPDNIRDRIIVSKKMFNHSDSRRELETSFLT